MLKAQEKPNQPLDGEHAANDKPHLDLRQYHGETLKLNHPCNKRRAENEKIKPI